MSENIIHNWLQLGEYDLETAQAMMKSGRYLYVAFTCHQAVEKILKAYYVKEKNETPPYTHNLIKLAKSLSYIPSLTDKQIEFLEEMNSFYIESRYSEHFEKMTASLSESVVDMILKQTEEFFRWLKELL